MITEIGDIKRFPHLRQLVSWIGMDIREYSSGGTQHRFGITKQGNRSLHTAFIEENQRGERTATVSKESKARRAHTAPDFVDIANRCLRRLNNKGNRLLLAGKHPNKVKVACAREMVGFVRESLHQAATSYRHQPGTTLRPMVVDLIATNGSWGLSQRLGSPREFP